MLWGANRHVPCIEMRERCTGSKQQLDDTMLELLHRKSQSRAHWCHCRVDIGSCGEKYPDGARCTWLDACAARSASVRVTFARALLEVQM